LIYEEMENIEKTLSVLPTFLCIKMIDNFTTSADLCGQASRALLKFASSD